MGAHLSHELPLRPLFHLTRDKIFKKHNTYGVVSPRYVLTQGSSLRSPTLGYQKQKAMGFVYSANSLCAAPPFERDEIKKAQHLRRCVPCYVLTQGSSLCSPTLGYQKRNPYGVLQSANILCVPLPFEIAIKAYPNGVRQSANILCGTPLSLERGWG